MYCGASSSIKFIDLSFCSPIRFLRFLYLATPRKSRKMDVILITLYLHVFILFSVCWVVHQCYHYEFQAMHNSCICLRFNLYVTGRILPAAHSSLAEVGWVCVIPYLFVWSLYDCGIWNLETIQVTHFVRTITALYNFMTDTIWRALWLA
jgi:hypothetical protein